LEGNKWIAFVDTENVEFKKLTNDLDLLNYKATNKALALKADVTALALKANTSDLTGLATTGSYEYGISFKKTDVTSL
jgi:hypothetical protein